MSDFEFYVRVKLNGILHTYMFMTEFTNCVVFSKFSYKNEHCVQSTNPRENGQHLAKIHNVSFGKTNKQMIVQNVCWYKRTYN